MKYYFECICCRETPTTNEWRKSNIGIESLGYENVPEDATIEELEEFVFDSGSALDCPACGERNEASDLEIF